MDTHDKGDMNMKDTLELAFLTDLNKTVHLQIPNPKTPISATDITTAMDAIVAANIFVFPTGRIVKKYWQRLIVVVRHKLRLVNSVIAVARNATLWRSLLCSCELAVADHSDGCCNLLRTNVYKCSIVSASIKSYSSIKQNGTRKQRWQFPKQPHSFTVISGSSVCNCLIISSV